MPPQVKSRAGKRSRLARTLLGTSAEAPERKAVRQIADRGDFRASPDGRRREAAISYIALAATDWPRNGPVPTPDYARNATSLWLTAILGDLLDCIGLLVWSFFFAGILVSSSSQLPHERAGERGCRPELSFSTSIYEIGNGRQNTTGGQEYFAIAVRP
jgi:hypothetical protein